LSIFHYLRPDPQEVFYGASINPRRKGYSVSRPSYETRIFGHTNQETGTEEVGNEMKANSGQPIARVTCVVNTCTHWENGNQCQASSIKIEPPNANSAQMTDCATFAAK
jgi:hypothetical protein